MHGRHECLDDGRHLVLADQMAACRTDQIRIVSAVRPPFASFAVTVPLAPA